MKRAFSIVVAIVAFSPPVLADMPDCLSGACIGRPFKDQAGFALSDENKCSGVRTYNKEENNISVEVRVNIGNPVDKIPTGTVYSIERRIVFPDHMGINQVVTDFKVKYGKPDSEEIWKNGRGIEMYYGKRSILTKRTEVRSVGNELSSTEVISHWDATVAVMDRQAECRSKQNIPD
jgi:hypothetical protein